MYLASIPLPLTLSYRSYWDNPRQAAGRIQIRVPYPGWHRVERPAAVEVIKLRTGCAAWLDEMSTANPQFTTTATLMPSRPISAAVSPLEPPLPLFPFSRKLPAPLHGRGERISKPTIKGAMQQLDVLVLGTNCPVELVSERDHTGDAVPRL